MQLHRGMLRGINGSLCDLRFDLMVVSERRKEATLKNADPEFRMIHIDRAALAQKNGWTETHSQYEGHSFARNSCEIHGRSVLQQDSGPRCQMAQNRLFRCRRMVAPCYERLAGLARTALSHFVFSRRL